MVQVNVAGEKVTKSVRDMRKGKTLTILLCGSESEADRALSKAEERGGEYYDDRNEIIVPIVTGGKTAREGSKKGIHSPAFNSRKPWVASPSPSSESAWFNLQEFVKEEFFEGGGEGTGVVEIGKRGRVAVREEELGG